VVSGQNWLFYAVQATESLMNPTSVTLPGSTAPFYDLFTFDDQFPAGTPQRFYRIVFEP
jgi:hypothetical protein